ncbi:MAG: hypothetical protein WD847_06410 [Pirellulales bacterium]
MTNSAARANSRPKPFRRWLQFRLLTLLAVMTICSIWLGTVVRQARNQREVVRTVLKLGGHVRYDYERPDPKVTNAFDPKGRPPGPAWLRRLVGDEYFVEVVRVDLVAAAVAVVRAAFAVPRGQPINHRRGGELPVARRPRRSA